MTKAWTSSLRIRPLEPVPSIRPRSAPSSRANLRTDGLAWALENAASSMGAPAPGASAGGDAGVLETGSDALSAAGGFFSAPASLSAGASPSAGALSSASASAARRAPRLSPGHRRRRRSPPADSPADSIVQTRDPSETLSPTETLTSATFPERGDGTSMLALSLSSVISGSFSCTSSPAETLTSMISTSLKSPISGTRTS